MNKRKYRVFFIDSNKLDYHAITEKHNREFMLTEIAKMFADSYSYVVYENEEKVFVHKLKFKYGQRLRSTRIKDMETKFVYDNLEHMMQETGLSQSFILSETRKQKAGLYQFVDEMGRMTIVHRKNRLVA